MRHVVRLSSRCAAAAACVTLGVTAPAFAQGDQASPPASVQFLPRYDFTMSAAALVSDDDRYSWDTHWTGDLDVVDYGRGRATFLADYQALLGSEFRPFDPYQSNYLLEGSGSVRTQGTEIALVFSHLSRHLGDRFKRLAVAENSLGVRVMRRAAGPDTTVDLRIDVRKVIAKAYLDYTSISELDVAARHVTGPKTQVYGRLFGQYNTVDKTVAGRTGQYGGRLEAGIELAGQRGAVDLFAGVERVVDADPLDRLPQRWMFVGFRLKRR